MIAQVCNLELGDFVHAFGDVHIYNNHQQQVIEQLSRQPSKLPSLKINATVNDLFDFTFDDFELQDYTPQSAIKAPVAV